MFAARHSFYRISTVRNAEQSFLPAGKLALSPVGDGFGLATEEVMSMTLVPACAWLSSVPAGDRVRDWILRR
jgi:hypothetical protein